MHEVEISRLAGRRQSGDTDHVEGEQVEEGVKTAQLRAEIEKLKQDHADHERTLVAEIAQLRGENEHLMQAQPGAVVSLGVAGWWCDISELVLRRRGWLWNYTRTVRALADSDVARRGALWRATS